MRQAERIVYAGLVVLLLLIATFFTVVAIGYRTVSIRGSRSLAMANTIVHSNRFPGIHVSFDAWSDNLWETFTEVLFRRPGFTRVRGEVPSSEDLQLLKKLVGHFDVPDFPVTFHVVIEEKNTTSNSIPNHASDATSEPARGTDSSSHQG